MNQGPEQGRNRSNTSGWQSGERGGNYGNRGASHYDGRGGQGYNDERTYGNNRDRSGYDDQYTGSRGRFEDEGYYGRGRSDYGTDRETGRKQDRYDSNERYSGNRGGYDYGRQQPGDWEGRSRASSDWHPGGRGYRTSQENNRNNSRYQENYSDEWNHQGRQRNPSYQQMEQNDGRRQTSGPWGRQRSRPSGKDDEGLRKLLTDQLQDMYWAEKAITKAIPKMIEKATSRELKDSFREHLQVTNEQIQKLEEIFSLLGEKAKGKKCPAMEGLVKEANEIIRDMDEGSVRDAGLICAAQKVEHYEIATYGCLSTYAQILDEMEVADLLEEILQEEKEADVTLTHVAKSINWEAAVEGEEYDEEEEDYEEEEEEEEDDDYEEEDEDDDENYDVTYEDEEEENRIMASTTNSSDTSELDAIEK